MKLQRQLCDGNADANADNRDDYKYLFLYLCFFHKELMDHIMRKPDLSYVNNKGANQPTHTRSLISALAVRCLDSNEILQFKAI